MDYDLFDQVVLEQKTVEGWSLHGYVGHSYNPTWDGSDLMSCDRVETYILTKDDKFYKISATENSWDGTTVTDPVEVLDYPVISRQWLTDEEAHELAEDGKLLDRNFH